MKVFALSFFFTFFVYAGTQVYTGEARTDGKVVYREKHSVEWNNDLPVSSLTIYEDPSGKPIGRLRNTYTKNLNAPEHVMDDLIHGSQHGVRYMNDKLIMFSKSEDEKEETKKIDEEDKKLIVGGQGFHYYLVTHLEEVIKKGKLDLLFLIPGRLDAYDFYLKVKEKTETKVTFEIEIDNWFLRLFAPKLVLEYDRNNKRLLKYRGLSNLKNDKNEMMNVEITYNYDN